ncbi:hypothetical protein STEG23_001160 [Scotinomys teguina]
MEPAVSRLFPGRTLHLESSPPQTPSPSPTRHNSVTLFPAIPKSPLNKLNPVPPHTAGTLREETFGNNTLPTPDVIGELETAAAIVLHGSKSLTCETLRPDVVKVLQAKSTVNRN